MSAEKETTRVAQRRRRKRAPEQEVEPHVLHLTQEQIQELRETFNFLDEDKDGVISRVDLRSVMVALGQAPSGKEIAEMLEEVQGVVDFTRFVSLFATMMRGTGDSDELVRSAFRCFDEDDDGFLSLGDLRAMLTSMGSRLTDKQVRIVLRGARHVHRGNFVLPIRETDSIRTKAHRRT